MTAAATDQSGEVVAVRDTAVRADFAANGVAEPVAQATVSTKLSGTVLEVAVREGDRVAAGQLLVRVDARDIDAQRARVRANVAAGEAAHREADLMARRIRALHADSAAARVQLDAAESALARALAGLEAAQAAELEVDAMADYAVVRAPFRGVVTRRFVDVGAFAAPGVPLVTLQDESRLRISASLPPAMAGQLTRGMRVFVVVEGVTASAVVEGVVPPASGSSSLYTINAIADNASGSLLSGGSATISVPTGEWRTLLVPAVAIRREGDLTGVTLAAGRTVRWVKLGSWFGEYVEVLSGLAAGDSIVVPVPVATR